MDMDGHLVGFARSVVGVGGGHTVGRRRGDYSGLVRSGQVRSGLVRYGIELSSLIVSTSSVAVVVHVRVC